MRNGQTAECTIAFHPQGREMRFTIDGVEITTAVFPDDNGLRRGCIGRGFDLRDQG